MVVWYNTYDIEKHNKLNYKTNIIIKVLYNTIDN